MVSGDLRRNDDYSAPNTGTNHSLGMPRRSQLARDIGVPVAEADHEGGKKGAPEGLQIGGDFHGPSLPRRVAAVGVRFWRIRAEMRDWL